MCRTCNGRFSVRERLANHDFIEQLKEFQGIPTKYKKNRANKNLKKSLVNKIEERLYRLQVEREFKYSPQLRSLLQDLSNNDMQAIQKQFEEIMISYYKEKLEGN
jgi:hypothetical protein